MGDEPSPGTRADQPRPSSLRAARGGLKRGFAALGIRNYRLYWSGQVVSLIGTWMQQVSLPWLVLALGGSPIQLGFVAVLQFGPSMILAPFGGVVADRIDKRRALMVTQLAAAGQAFVLFLGGHRHGADLDGHGHGALARPGQRGRDAAPPGVRRRARAAALLANAIALNSMAFNSARVVGPALAGVIIAAGTASPAPARPASR